MFHQQKILSFYQTCLCWYCLWYRVTFAIFFLQEILFTSSSQSSSRRHQIVLSLDSSSCLSHGKAITASLGRHRGSAMIKLSRPFQSKDIRVRDFDVRGLWSVAAKRKQNRNHREFFILSDKTFLCAYARHILMTSRYNEYYKNSTDWFAFEVMTLCFMI